MSRRQAAVSAGHCGPNIRSVFRHLPAGHDPPGPPGPLWGEVLGRAAQPIDAIAEEAADSRIARLPGVLFADQAKAFDRLSLAWFAEVLPPWLVRPMLSLVVGRAVRMHRDGRPGPLRRLYRPLGMGGGGHGCAPELVHRLRPYCGRAR